MDIFYYKSKSDNQNLCKLEIGGAKFHGSKMVWVGEWNNVYGVHRLEYNKLSERGKHIFDIPTVNYKSKWSAAQSFGQQITKEEFQSLLTEYVLSFS